MLPLRRSFRLPRERRRKERRKRRGGGGGGERGRSARSLLGEGMKKKGSNRGEFRNDRRPVASLTDDALPRSRLQAQKDGTAVMDSKWLEIVGRCHRARSLSLSPLVFLWLLSLFALPSSHGRNSRHAMHSLSKAGEGPGRMTRVELRGILPSTTFCVSELPLTRAQAVK